MCGFLADSQIESSPFIPLKVKGFELGLRVRKESLVKPEVRSDLSLYDE